MRQTKTVYQTGGNGGRDDGEARRPGHTGGREDGEKWDAGAEMAPAKVESVAKNLITLRWSDSSARRRRCGLSG